jgi:hypothetical protein
VITKADLEGRARREKPSKSESSKQQTWVWACSGIKGVCQGRMHPRIDCAVHGTEEEAKRCSKKAAEAQGGIG